MLEKRMRDGILAWEKRDDDPRPICTICAHEGKCEQEPQDRCIVWALDGFGKERPCER